jgi:hypothetical protein
MFGYEPGSQTTYLCDGKSKPSLIYGEYMKAALEARRVDALPGFAVIGTQAVVPRPFAGKC